MSGDPSTTPTTASGDAEARAAFAEAEKARRSPPAPEKGADAKNAAPTTSTTAPPPAPVDEGAAAEDAAAVARVSMRAAAAFFVLDEEGADDVARRFGRRVGAFLSRTMGGWLGVLATVAELVEWALAAHLRHRKARAIEAGKGGAS